MSDQGLIVRDFNFLLSKAGALVLERAYIQEELCQRQHNPNPAA